MKKIREKIWRKRLLSSVICAALSLGGICSGTTALAASPSDIPESLTLPEATGVCSGSATAFRVDSPSFRSNKLKFYQDMLNGTHEKTNASTKSGAPEASAAEDWFNVAYMLHQNRGSQSGTSNYSSRMDAMRYCTIAEYNNTGKLKNNEYDNGYCWAIHRSGLNYSNSLSNANTDIRKKLYEYYLAQHTSGSNKKGWDWNDKSATHNFSGLSDNTKQDVFWSILSLNRSEGDSRRRGHGSALIAVFYDFQVSPVLPEDTGTTYIRQRTGGMNQNDSYVSSITNNSSQDLNVEYTGSTESTVSHTSNISGSSSYTMGHSVTVGTNVNFGAFASGSVEYTFDYSNTIEKGWASEDSISKTERKEDKSSISIPAYSAIKMKRTTSDSDEVTSYNCPVLLTYKVMLLEHVLNASNDEADAATATLGVFGNSSVSAREDLKTYLTDNLNIKDTSRGITWSTLASRGSTAQAFQYALANTAQYLPMASAGATYSVNLKTVHISYDGLISTQPLSKVKLVGNTKNLSLLAGASTDISDIKVRGINAAGKDYIGFQQSKGHWILTSANGKEDKSGKIATLSTDRSGKTTLKARSAGTVYLEYVINENCYATASAPTSYMTNKKLASTAILKVTIKKPKTITLSAASTKPAPGTKIKLTTNLAKSKAKWSSSNTKLATIDSNGVVKINKKAAGKKVTLTVTAKDGTNRKKSITLSVMKGAVKKISLKGAKSVKAGKSLTLKATVTATKGANTKLSWTSGNTKYAAVSQKGKVTAKKAGKNKTVTITAAATDGTGKKATFKVKIK